MMADLIGYFKSISDAKGKYAVDDRELREQIANSAHIDIVNFVTDLGGGGDDDDAAADLIPQALEEHWGVYIPDGLYNFTSYHVLTGNIIISDTCLDNNAFLLVTRPLNYSSNAIQLLKSGVKPFDQMSFQGGCERNNAYYVGYRNDTTTQIKVYNQLMQLTNTYAANNLEHCNSLFYMNTRYYVAPIGPNLLTFRNPASVNAAQSVTMSGNENEQIVLACPIGNSVIACYTEGDMDKIKLFKGSGTVFTLFHTITGISRPAGGNATGLNGMCYFKGNFYIAYTDTRTDQRIRKNFIRVYGLDGKMLAEWKMDDSYDTKEIEWLQADEENDQILLFEYGNNWIYDNTNTMSIWAIKPYEGGLQQGNTQIGYGGLVGAAFLHVDADATSFGDGTPEKPFKSLQAAINAASNFQAVYIEFTGTITENIVVKLRPHYIEINGKNREGTLNGSITIHGCGNVAIRDINFGGITGQNYQILTDASKVVIDGCNFPYSATSNGVGAVSARSNSQIDLTENDFSCRTIAFVDRNSSVWLDETNSGTVYNQFYNDGGIVLGNDSGMTATYRSNTQKYALTKLNSDA